MRTVLRPANKVSPLTLALAVLVSSWPGVLAQVPVAPAESPDPLYLLRRLDSLERHNDVLENSLQEQRERVRQLELKLLERNRLPSEFGLVPGAPPSPAARTDDRAIKDVVDTYLRAEIERQKQSEERQKKEAEARGFEVGKDLKISATWRDGVQFETGDKAFRFTVGGRVDFDSTWYNSSRALSNSLGQFNNFADPNLGLTDGAEFRRTRLRFQGTMWEVMEFNCEYDFANFIDLRRRTLGVSTPTTASTVNDFEPSPGVRLADLWLGFNKLPVLGTFRAGHQKEWLTFTNATSGRFLTFIERPLLFDAFNDDFQFSDGFTLQRNFFDNRAYGWVGIFRVNSRTGAFDVGDGDYAYDARFSFLPVWSEDECAWVHLGLDYSYRNLHMDQTRFRARPLVHSGTAFQVPNIVNSGIISSRDAQQVANLEFASAWGPLTLTSEVALSWVTNAFTNGLPLPNGRLPAGVTPRGTYLARGWYAEALYFLTGEHRTYRRDQPSYDRIRPVEQFYCVRGEDGPTWGRGAWEVGLRYDFLDLTDSGINGGVAQAVTLGLNWHLNPNMKVQWNYVWMDRQFEPADNAGRRAGDFHGLGMRFHWDF